MKRCAFLTTDDLTGFVTDDELAVGPLQDLGWQVDQVSWRADADWDGYDVVIVRSTWDYQDHPEAFDVALQRIDRSRALLLNPLPLMRWNMRKTYLRELAERGVALLPTVWGDGSANATRADSGEIDRGDPGIAGLRGLFQRLATDEIVIKPVVGANADHAWRLTRDVDDATLSRVAAVYAVRPFLAQPFQRQVVEEGEFSLIYVAGAFSHAILKTPKSGDFRVQEEHGGIITAVTPDPLLQRRAEEAMAALPTSPFYARADFVRTDTGDFAMMEFELIEPALYFRMSPGAAENFAQALTSTLNPTP